MRVMREHGPALSRLVAGYDADPREREDLLQDIAFAVWKALPSFRGASSERTFILRIGHNCALTHVRRRRRARLWPLDDADAVPDPRASPERCVVEAQEHERLMAAVRDLPAAYRQVIMLSLEELSNREVADVLGITENNVAVRLTRARKMLGERLTRGRVP